MRAVVRFVLFIVFIVAAPIPGGAGGLSGDTARAAQCEDALAACAAEPLAGKVCAHEFDTLACVLARVARDTLCLEGYDICLKTGGFPVPEIAKGAE